MDAQTLLPALKARFGDYVRRFASDDPIVQENMDLKAEHTRRVCEAILDVGRSLRLSAEDLCLAETSALLHDIGRFEQYRCYRTFADYKSEDHAALGVKVIQTERALEVPRHLKDATLDKDALGHGKGYKYAHDYKDHYVKQEYKPSDKIYYIPTNMGYERKIKEWLEYLDKAANKVI